MALDLDAIRARCEQRLGRDPWQAVADADVLLEEVDRLRERLADWCKTVTDLAAKVERLEGLVAEEPT